MLLYRLEFLVARVKLDLDTLDKLLTDAESTVEGGTFKSFMPIIFVRSILINDD